MIYIVPIEPIDQRYTLQWYSNIPKMLKARGLESHTIAGEEIDQGTTTGAFLDFGATNAYKASQVQRISKLFTEGAIKPGDKFLVTDAWNFAITAIRYMSDLLNIPVEIHGIWHAGAYDPTDILGMKMSKPWPWHQETAWFHACDYNYFATNFHANMFVKNLDINPSYKSKVIVSGQPHEIMVQTLKHFSGRQKTNCVVWPHRYNADKQPEIAEDLKKVMAPDTAWIITQKLNLNKANYYNTLAESAVLFSCSLHENLGISVMEAVLLGTIPILPDRCSYSEMYLPEFLYPSAWTEHFVGFLNHKAELIDFIHDRVHNPSKYAAALEQQKQILLDKYLNANVMYDNLCS